MKPIFAPLLALALVLSAPAVLARQAAGVPAKAAAPATQKQAATASSPEDRHCLRSTGSRIPPKRGECLPVAGRSYNAKDIQRTGARDAADALRMLDPAIH